MPRVPASEIERLKEEVSLVRLVEAAGVRLEKRGKDLVGRCPFHDDRTPSFVVTPGKNLWHCLGACGEGGDVIAFVMRREGVSFRHAVELLRDDYALSPVPDAKAQPPSRSTVQKLEPLDAPDTDDQALLNRVASFYHETLKASSEGLGYLKKRGLDNGEMIERFRLGLANRTLGYRLPEKNRKAGAEIRGRLQKLGILRASGHEHFAGSLVIPVIDPGPGAVREMYGRKLLDNLRKGTAKHLYLPGPHKGVFNLEAFSAADEIILCESLIDALTFWGAGYRNVTASYGVNGFTAEILAAFRSHGIKRVLIAYDRDAGGEKAGAEVAQTLMGEGIEAFRILFPKGMDANEYALQVKPAAQSLGVLIRSATWLGTGPSPARRVHAATPDSFPAAHSEEAAKGKETGASAARSVAPRAPAQAVPAAEPSEHEPSSSLAAEPGGATGAESGAEIPPEPPASPVPPGPQAASAPPDIPAEVTEHEVRLSFGDPQAATARHWRVRGLARNMSYETLRVNVLVRREVPESPFHVDAFDLYNARARAGFVAQASAELGLSAETVKGDLARVLLKLEALQDEQIRVALEPKAEIPAMTAAEEKDALALLRAPDLLERIVQDAELCGIVGERANVLALYLSGISRKLEKPLAVLIQSTSAAGKSALMDAVLAFVPEEERVHYAAMTGQALFYLGETAVRHKVLAIAEEEGARDAAYALKLLQSQGELTIASTGKDPVTGKLVTQEYRVEGPVALAMTTTAIDLDEELRNRCLVLTVNEGQAQTAAIHARQRFEETLQGLMAAETRAAVLTRHRNAQRLLRPLKVVNPYAEHLTFRADRTRTRRDHGKYLALIRAIALLHQHQRPVKTARTADGESVEYVEATLDDIAAANALAHEVLGRTLDELPPQTRALLTILDGMVTAACAKAGMRRADVRFTRREVREACGWGLTQLRVHLTRLQELEYLIVHRGMRGRSFVYELAYEGEGADGDPFLMGLIDVERLRNTGTEHSGENRYDGKLAGANGEVAGSKRPQNGGKTGPERPAGNGNPTTKTRACADDAEFAPERASGGTPPPHASYANGGGAA